MHRKFKKQCFLGFQDLNNALEKKKKICTLKPRIAQPIGAESYFSTYILHSSFSFGRNSSVQGWEKELRDWLYEL